MNNTQFLAGKKAIVTGGSRGIGLEVARYLAAAGADVAIGGRNEQSLQAALKELQSGAESATGRGKIAGFPLDVSRNENVEAFFGQADGFLRSLDILVNNAGI